MHPLRRRAIPGVWLCRSGDVSGISSNAAAVRTRKTLLIFYTFAFGPGDGKIPEFGRVYVRHPPPPLPGIVFIRAGVHFMIETPPLWIFYCCGECFPPRAAAPSEHPPGSFGLSFRDRP